MNRARCNVDRRLWSAMEFSRLAAADLDRLRRHLECAGCGALAFFRGRSRDGRVACFGSTEHRPGCSDAATHAAATLAGDPELAGVDVIRVSSLSPDQLQQSRARPGESNRREMSAPGGPVRRSLRTLLRHILREPAFLYSETRIEAAGCPVLSARDFFVRFEQITSRHRDQDRGFWGTVISYGYGTAKRPTTSATEGPAPARRPPAGAEDHESIDHGPMHPGQFDLGRDVWLNAGPPGEPSILVRAGQVQDLARLNLLTSWEDLVGCPVLILGRCVESRNGKVYIRPISASHMAFLDWD